MFWKESAGHSRPKPWLEWALALLGACLLFGGWPPYGRVGLLFLAFTPFLALMEYVHAGGFRKPGRRALFKIWLALLVWNTLSTSWVAQATLVGAIAMIVLNSGLMLLPWVFYSWAKIHLSRLALLFGGLAWLTLEYAHFHWEMAWPWLNLGFGFANNPDWVQWYEYTGVLGGTLWVLIVNGALYFALWRDGGLLRGRVRPLSVIYALVLGIGIPLSISYLVKSSFEAKGTATEVVLLQPNLNPYTNRLFAANELASSHEIIDYLLDKTETAITPNTQWVLWPESTLPRFIWEDDHSNANLLKIQQWQAQYPQLSLLVGATTGTNLAPEDPTSPYTITKRNGTGRYEAHNTAIWFPAGGRPQFYHKSVLVPGVEQLPFANILQPVIGPLMEALGGTGGGYAPQNDRTVFTPANGLSIAPSVCYESIFGAHTAKHVRKGAQAIGVITNDAWWGQTQGYQQHFAYSRLLAISLRKPVLRAANTGTSAFVHPDGSFTQATDFYTEATLREEVLFSDKLTVYAKTGDSLGRLAGFLFFFLWTSAIVKRKIKR